MGRNEEDDPGKDGEKKYVIERDFQVLGVRRWTELVTDWTK
jgi:hypothetical protein